MSWSVVSALNDEFAAVAILVDEARSVLEMTLHGPDPALLRADDGDRLLLDHRLLEVDIDLRRFGKIGAALAERRSSCRTSPSRS